MSFNIVETNESFWDKKNRIHQVIQSRFKNGRNIERNRHNRYTI